MGENEAIVAVLSLALERIEQAVDAIAIEAERIFEGQRFLTRVMAGREPERAGLYPASKVEHSA